jgi:drug/metabolite transporter (DMT)-like permease
LNLNTNMKSRRNLNLLLLHIIVFIWGFTGILGFEITLDTFPLVWWRVLIAFMALFLFSMLFKKKVKANRKDILKFFGVGLLIAAHWACFFGSIKASNISVALVVISTTAFFVSLISPIIRKEKFHWYELLLGILVVVGLTFIFRFESQYTKGILLSMGAAVLAAVFSTINSTLITKHDSIKIATWEMLSAFLSMSVFLFITGGLNEELLNVNTKDFSLLLLLGIVCTGFAFVAGIEVMKVLSPFTCALALNLEPVYTILIALWLYGSNEVMSLQFYIGAAIILSTLFIEVWLKKKFGH